MSPDATPAPPSAPEIAARLAHAGRGDRRQLVGVELEMALLRREDLSPAPYEGPAGVAAFLERLLAAGDATPEREAGRLVGLSGPGGRGISLEPGGQVEISTAPQPNVSALDRDLRAATRRLAGAAEAEGLLLVAGSLVPAPAEACPWMPKSRYACMRDYFAGLGERGRLAPTMMQRTLSTQVSVDYAHADDGADLLRLGLLAAPVATAIFAHSPLDGVEESGLLSLRAESWLATDPDRCGDVPACAAPAASVRDYVEYALDVPMIFRAREDGLHEPMHGASFRAALESGRFPDGVPVQEHHVWDHMSGAFPNARLKRGLVELRSTDGQRPDELSTIAAFWTGVLYDLRSRDEARELLGGADPAERQRANAEVPRRGLAGALAGRPLRDVARDLVEIARRGLERQVEAGDEAASTLELLAPVADRVAAGTSPAEQLLADWRTRWERDPRRLVEALAFSP